MEEYTHISMEGWYNKDRWMDGEIAGWVHISRSKRIGRWIAGWVDGWLDGSMDICIYGWTEGWMAGQMDGSKGRPLDDSMEAMRNMYMDGSVQE